MSVRSGGFPSGLRNLTALNDVDGSVALLNGDGLVYNSTSGLWVPTGVATATRAESHYYADGTSGSDSNDGLTAATPKKTLQAVFDLVPFLESYNVAVHLTGTFSEGGLARLYRASGTGQTLLVEGDITDTTIVADDTGSPWAADIVSTSSIGLSTAGWVADAYAGYWVEILSGPAAGQTRLIITHTATTITPARNFSVSPGAGAQFRIIRPTTTLSSTSIMAQFPGGTVAYQGLYLTGSSYVGTASVNGLIGNVFSHMVANTSGAGYGPYVTNIGGSASFRGGYINPSTFAFVNSNAGTHCGVSAIGTTDAFQADEASRVIIYSCYFKQQVVVEGVMNGFIAGLGTRFGGGLQLNECAGDRPTAQILTTAGYATTTVEGVGIKLVRSALHIAAGVSISNSSTHGIEVDGSRLYLNGAVVGTSNTGAGVYAHSGSVVRIKNGSPPTLTGTVGDISVDGTTPASSWTDVDAGYPVGPAHTTGIAVKGNVVATAIATVNVWVQFLGFDTNLATNGPTPDHTNDHIVIKRAGTYLIEFDVSFSAEADPDTYEIEVQLNNGATSTRAALERVVDAAGDIGAGSGRDILTLAAGDTVELWVRNTTDAHDPTLHNVVLTVREIDSPSEAEGVLVKEV